MTLIEFLRAVLDEDEAAATAWSTPFSNPTAQQREHIARHDPARVLRLVAAHRRIVDACEHTLDCPNRSSKCYARAKRGPSPQVR